MKHTFVVHGRRLRETLGVFWWNIRLLLLNCWWYLSYLVSMCLVWNKTRIFLLPMRANMLVKYLKLLILMLLLSFASSKERIIETVGEFDLPRWAFGLWYACVYLPLLGGTLVLTGNTVITFLLYISIIIHINKFTRYQYFVGIHRTSAVASLIWGGQNIWGEQNVFRRLTLFCLEKRLSKHQMTIFSKNLGAMALWPPLATLMHRTSIIQFQLNILAMIAQNET